MAQTREAKRANTLWQSCPPFYSGAFTIGTIVGQVNVSIQHVSRGILSTRCAPWCDGQHRPICLETSHCSRTRENECFFYLLFLKFYTIMDGIWFWKEVRKWVLFVECLQQQKWNGMQRQYCDSAVISVLPNVLANYPWSANFIIPVFMQALINSHQCRMDESHFLSSQQTCESWCGKPC